MTTVGLSCTGTRFPVAPSFFLSEDSNQSRVSKNPATKEADVYSIMLEAHAGWWLGGGPLTKRIIKHVKAFCG